MQYSMPRVVIAGLSGGSGKTMLSTGLARAFTRQGLRVQSFKKGPDYIDTLWLGLAAQCTPRNLDPYMTPEGLLPHIFAGGCAKLPRFQPGEGSQLREQSPALAIIEGNRGIFDGQDIQGSCSTAEVARQLSAPVILVMNCAKMTRTAAAIVQGIKNFEPGLNLAGVILNRVSRSRHRSIVQQAVEELAGLRVLGLIPNCGAELFEERQSGLYSAEAVRGSAASGMRLDALADFISQHVDMEAVLAVAQSAPPLDVPKRPEELAQAGAVQKSKVRIGYVRDEAFWFYYAENLEALERAGAELLELAILDSKPWPELDGLYLGGGFPGEYAGQLADNGAKKAEVAALVRAGLPTYAEGPGFYYLTRAIEVGGTSYPMAGIFDFELKLGKVPRGIGYVQARVEKNNPFHPVGSVINAHEFHYTDIGMPGERAAESLLYMNKGTGMFYTKGQPGRDGLLKYNCFISHMQLYAPGANHWANNFVKVAGHYRAGL